MIRVRFIFADGHEEAPGRLPETLILKSDADTPADGLTMRFKTEKRLFETEPVGAVLCADGKVLMNGILDEHRVKAQNGVQTEFFSLRRRAALLLDNEAMPQEIRLPSLRLLEKLYLEPLQLRAVGGDRSAKPGVLTVQKGVCCWDVLCMYAERFLDCTPWADESGDIHFEKFQAGKIVLEKITALERIFCPYKQLSKVTVQNAQTGAYSAGYNDPTAVLPRVRYLSAYAQTAPKKLILERRREAERLSVVCAAYIDGVPGDVAVFEDAGQVRLVSKEVTVQRGQAETKLMFEPAEA